MKKFYDLPVEEQERLLKRLKVDRIGAKDSKPLKVREI